MFFPRMYSLDGEDCSVEVSTGTNSGPLDHAFLNYGCDAIKLQGWIKFKRCLGERAVQFLKDPKLQYVVVEDVSASDIDQIDYFRSHGEFPQMRILYDEEKRLMIVKLRFGVPHEVAVALFNELFQQKVPSSTGILPIGSARFGEAIRRHKEADQSYFPGNTRGPNPDWPSVVVEVGVFESLPKLQEDARYWLISSGGRVFVVILISIDLSTREVIWERWEHVPSIGPMTRRQTTRIHPTLMQIVTLSTPGPVIGAPFLIPTNKIWDIVPNHIGAEIVFNAQQLDTYLRTLQQVLY